MRYHDRREAGRRLAAELVGFNWERPIVLALPRGGVPVGYEVAEALNAPLDVIVVRKIGAPLQPELGIGAVAEGGALYLNWDTVREVGLEPSDVEELAAQELGEVDRRVRQYRRGRALPALQARTVLLVDDGVATGSTLRAAIRAVRSLGASEIVVAVPVGATSTLNELRSQVDDVVCPLPRDDLFAIGQWYDRFTQCSDDDVEVLLLAANRRAPAAATESRSLDGGGRREVRVAVGDAVLPGVLTVPREAEGLVLFAHGSGSSRHSPRNRYVADVLQAAGVATVLMDLLTAEEEAQDAVTGQFRFDLPLLAGRVVAAIDWTLTVPDLVHLPLGLFGASTGAAAALTAAAGRPGDVRAVVSRGGRPDLAGESLSQVYASTLLIVGGEDEGVLELNRRALLAIPAEKQLVIVPGATHLFEETGALERVAGLAADWFREHFATGTEARV